MKLHYFAIDGRGQLCRISGAAVRGLWEGRLRSSSLGGPAGNELRLVSVACNSDMLPQKV